MLANSSVHIPQKYLGVGEVLQQWVEATDGSGGLPVSTGVHKV